MFLTCFYFAAKLPISALTAKRSLTEIQHHLLGRQQLEGEAVIWRGAAGAYRLAVCRGWVTLVGVPVILGKLAVQPEHALIAVCLGQYAGSGYAHVSRIALHYSGVGKVSVGLEAVAVHDDFLRPHLQLVQRAVHGQNACIEDVYLVYLMIIYDAHRPCQCFALDDGTQFVAALRAQLLRVIEQVVVIIGREDDCRCIDRSCQTASAGLVTTSLNYSLLIIFLAFALLFCESSDEI